MDKYKKLMITIINLILHNNGIEVAPFNHDILETYLNIITLRYGLPGIFL